MRITKLNLKHFSIIFSIAGIILLYFIVSISKPAQIKLSEIKDFEGKKIITKGYVNEITETKYKNQIITIQNNNSSVIVFSEEKKDLEYGDLIKVKGEVQKYKNDFEIIVENIEDINLLKKWDNITLPIWQIAIEPSRYIGLNVKVKGYIDNLFNSFFHLKDIEKNYTILVSYFGGSDIYLKTGKEVIVKGVFTYDGANCRYMIKLFNETHGVFLRG